MLIQTSVAYRNENPLREMISKLFLIFELNDQLIAGINHKHALHRDYKQAIFPYFTYSAHNFFFWRDDEKLKNRIYSTEIFYMHENLFGNFYFHRKKFHRNRRKKKMGKKVHNFSL